MTAQSPQKIAILGAGAWGTALGIHLAKQGHQVCLWSHSKVTAERLSKSRQNQRYLKEVIFPENLEVTANFDQAIEAVHAILVVVPSRPKGLNPKPLDCCIKLRMKFTQACPQRFYRGLLLLMKWLKACQPQWLALLLMR